VATLVVIIEKLSVRTFILPGPVPAGYGHSAPIVPLLVDPGTWASEVQGRATRGFFQTFFRGGQMWCDLFFPTRIQENNLFSPKCSKFRKERGPSFPTPMPWNRLLIKPQFIERELT